MKKTLSKTANWLLRHALTVGTCVLIIVLGIVLLARSSPGTTTIGENITTGNITASGTISEKGTALSAKYGPKKVSFYLPGTMSTTGGPNSDGIYINNFRFQEAVTLEKVFLSAQTPPQGDNLVAQLSDGTATATATLASGNAHQITDITDLTLSPSQDLSLKVTQISSYDWTTYGVPNGEDPNACLMGVATDSADRIYIANHDCEGYGRDRIVRMDDMNGANWIAYGSTGWGEGKFERISDIAFDSDGKIYIADYRIDGMGKIVRIDNMTGAGWTTYDVTPDLFIVAARGIALDSEDKIYVASTANHRIFRIDNMNGDNYKSFGSQGSGVNQFQSPYKIALDSTGRIYITDPGNQRIVRIDDMDGTNWTTYTGSGDTAFDYPTGIFIDSNDKIYVADKQKKRIVRFDDMSGTNWISYSGPSAGDFTEARGIYLDSQGRIYIACKLDNLGNPKRELIRTRGIGPYVEPQDINLIIDYRPQ